MADKDVPYSLRDFIIDNIQLDKQIGRGANGRILEAKWEGAIVAVKEIHSIFINEVSEPEFQAFKRSFLRECEQSSRLRHPNIVRFFGIYWPPRARAPSLVMERLHCSLTSLLEQHSVLPIDTKLAIIRDVALGLRYLHTRTPIIIHRDLSSNNVLISKGMEGKIGDLGTVRLVDPTRQSRMTKAPGTVDFMPPEALAGGDNVKYERELDVFSFGCVMLHTLSHQWPTPSEPVVTDPVTYKVKGRTEAERRNGYFDNIENKIDRSRSGVLIPVIKSCLDNIPKNRASIVTVCNQLERLVFSKQHSPVDDIDLPLSALEQEMERKDIEIQNKDIQIRCQAAEIEALKTGMAKLQMQLKAHPISPKADILSRQVSKSSTDFWNNLKLNWEQCADLPVKCWATSVTELDGKVYVTPQGDSTNYVNPLVYYPHEDEWSVLPKLPHVRFSLVAVPHRKQLLAIGGLSGYEVSNKVFAWDEDNRKWTTPYPNMPTARYDCCSISHGSAVIVAGGITCHKPLTFTGTVEVLHINEHNGSFSKSHWSEVEQLPYAVYELVPLKINDNLYIAVGNDDDGSTCNIVTAYVPELLQSGFKNTTSSGSRVWHKLPDMPYSSWSINHYQGHLIIFTGDCRVEQPGQSEPTWELISHIHLYNPNTKSWDHVGDVPYDYLMGKSVHLRENKLLFVSGVIGTHIVGKSDDMLTTCSILTVTPK